MSAPDIDATYAAPDTADRASRWGLMAPIKGRLVVALAIQFVSALASVVPFIAVAELARTVVGSETASAADVWFWGRLAAGALVVRALTALLAGAITHYADNDLQLILRRRIARRLEQAPLGWFTQRSAGAIKKGMSDDVVAMHHLVAHAALEMVSAIVVPVAMLAYLFSVDWRLTLAVLAPVLAGVALYGRMFATGHEAWKEVSISTERVNASAVEFIQGISVVKTFGSQGRSYGRFMEAARHHARIFHDMVARSLRITAAGDVVMAPLAALLTVIGTGLLMVRQDWIEPVTIIPFAVLGLGILGPLFGMWSAVTALAQARTASKRVAELLETPVLPLAATPAKPADNRLELKNVSFSYDGEREALNGVSFVMEPGTVTALVGRSGAGKSTIARLIPRFWDVTGGAILLGGQGIRDIAPKTLYAHVSFVFQDVQLLRASIRDNIRLARPDASDDEVQRAARAAQIHERILTLPRSYDSVAGEDALLSGGEAQRVSIARAILADAPILVLDEATAFADPESEAQIQDALSELVAGRTLLVIAHRLSTVRHVDNLVVMDGGRIVEAGTHDELIARDGLYARLWQHQERAETWSPRDTKGTNQ